MKSELRKDYIQEKYVIIAPRRKKRPYDVERPERIVPLSKGPCGFCPEGVEKELVLERIFEKRKTKTQIGVWQFLILKNKYPAVTLDNPKAYGIQEVIVETPDHIKELEDLSTNHIAQLLEVYAERTKRISQDEKIEYVLIFKNSGGKAGASLTHAHSQIFATSFLPPHLFDKSQKTLEYKLKYGRCVYCDVIKKEAKGPRLIWQDKYIMALCPWASIHNYEAWILPKRHIDNVTLLNKRERFSMSWILKRILKKIDRLGLPYNFYFHQVIHDENQHLYMKITPRGSVWAGVEIGSGIVINPIPPEEAAKFYRS